MSFSPLSQLDTGFIVCGTCKDEEKITHSELFQKLSFGRIAGIQVKNRRVILLLVGVPPLKGKSFFVPLLHKPQSPLLSGDGQRLRPLLLRLLSSRLLIAAARLEQMCVNEDFPKTAFIDNPATYFLPKRKKWRGQNILIRQKNRNTERKRNLVNVNSQYNLIERSTSRLITFQMKKVSSTNPSRPG